MLLEIFNYCVNPDQAVAQPVQLLQLAGFDRICSGLVAQTSYNLFWLAKLTETFKVDKNITTCQFGIEWNIYEIFNKKQGLQHTIYP